MEVWNSTQEPGYAVMYGLLAAWIHCASPDWADEQEIDFEDLWRISDRHSLSAAVCMALRDTGLLIQCPTSVQSLFEMAEAQSIRRTLLMDAEREALIRFMEKQGIWYMPLKGIVLRDLYPKIGARQIADNDILFDAAYRSVVQRHMEQRGYRLVAGAGETIHDTYQKPPVYAFEMHRLLFEAPARGNAYSDKVVSYYTDVKSRLIKDPDNQYGWHFNEEDCYIYLLAHAYKHHERGGTGVRTLLDLYLYRQSRAMNEAYLAGELEKLGLLDFERLCCDLAKKLFSWPQATEKITPEERKMLSWMEASGTYGTVEHQVVSQLEDNRLVGKSKGGRSKCRYLLDRLFPDLSWYKRHAPFAYQHRWAIPFFWMYWVIRSLFSRGKLIRKELVALWRA